LREEWFRGDEVVLVTAGASAPERVVQDCIALLRDRFGAVLEQRTVREENVRFALPRALR
jgi:4-hydroxy-3-methylbut-2-enyl diphosphate reductase